MRIQSVYEVHLSAGELADGAVGHRSAVRLRVNCPALAGRVRGVQVARRPSFRISCQHGRRVGIRFRLGISSPFLCISGTSSRTFTYRERSEVQVITSMRDTIHDQSIALFFQLHEYRNTPSAYREQN